MQPNTCKNKVYRLDDIQEDVGEDQLPLLPKTLSDLSEGSQVGKGKLEATLLREFSKSTSVRPKSKKTTPRESYKDIASSLLKQSHNKVDWMKRFYKEGSDMSPNVLENVPSNPFNKEPDLEAINKSGSSYEETAAGKLYMADKLVSELGFRKSMVMNVLTYDKDIIKDDITKAVELLVKSAKGWLHTFVPEQDVRSSQGFPHFLDQGSNEELKEKCQVGGEFREEHSKSTSFNSYAIRSFQKDDQRENRFNMSKIIEEKTQHSIEFEEHKSDNKDEEQSDNSNEFHSDEDCSLGSIGFLEQPISQMYSLSCNHGYGLVCLNLMFESNIKDGKINQIKGPNYTGDRTYAEVDIKRIIKDEELLTKYIKFSSNYEINVNPKKQWCPYPNGEEWVRGNYRNSKVTCKNGHDFGFNCQHQGWHKGNGKDNLDVKLLNYVSENNVARCPKCKVRTEKNEGCNHMSCIGGYQWGWICRGKYTYDHYSSDNIYGCGNMQFTIGWGKCKTIFYLLFFLYVGFPFILLFKPLGQMTEAVYSPYSNPENLYSGICGIPRGGWDGGYDSSGFTMIFLSGCYYPFIIPIGIVIGVFNMIIFFPVVFVVTHLKVFRLMFRDGKGLQSK